MDFHLPAARILIFRFDRIGDMVVTTPFIRDLRRAHPTAVLDVLCGPKNKFVLDKSPHVDNCFIWAPSVLGIIWLAIMRGKYDLVVDLNHSVIWRDLLMIRMLRPKYAASVFKQGKYGIRGVDLKIFQVMPQHECRWSPKISASYLDLAVALGATETRDLRYELHGSNAWKIYAGPINHPKRSWVVNQFGGRPQMAIRAHDVKLIVEKLLRLSSTHKVVMACSPETYAIALSQKETWFAGCQRVSVYEATNNPLDVCDLLASALGLISPDTSLVHMGAAFDLPMVVLYANEPHLYAQWSPLTSWDRHIFSENPKSLEGYRSSELLAATEELVLRRNSKTFVKTLGGGSHNSPP